MGVTLLLFTAIVPVRLSVAKNGCVRYAGASKLCGSRTCVIDDSA